MSDDSDDEVGVLSTSAKKTQRKGFILSDDSADESEIKKNR